MEPRPDQKKALERLIDNKNKNINTLLALPCGFGKTFLSLLYANYFKSVLILVPNKIIMNNSWIANNIIKDHIHITMQRQFYNKIMKNNDKPFYELIIVDEFHLNRTLVQNILNKINKNILIGLTATPDLSIDGKFFQDRIVKKANKVFKVIFTIIPFNIPTFKHKRNVLINGEYISKLEYDYTKMMKHVVENQQRQKFVADYCLEKIKLSNENNIFILVKNIITLNYIETFLKSNNIDVTTLFGNNNTYNKNSKVLIGTFLKCGVGFDTNRYNILIIIDNLLKIDQAVGRLRNDNFTIYDISDNHSIFEYHRKIRKKFYQDIGGDCCLE